MIKSFIKAGHKRAGEMNKTELNYYNLLKLEKLSGLIREFEFEKIKFKIDDNCYYTPDFFIVDKDDNIKIIEVKGGYITDDAIVKFKACCRIYHYFKWEMWQLKKNKWSKIKEN